MTAALVIYRNSDLEFALLVVMVAVLWLLAQFWFIGIVAKWVGRFEQRMFRRRDHDAARGVKKRHVGFAVALVLVVTLGTALSAARDDIDIPNMCKVWTSDDVEWWIYGCWGLPDGE